MISLPRGIALQALRAALVVSAVAAGVDAARSGSLRGHLAAVAILAVIAAIAENTAIVLPSSASISPGFMIIIASIAALRGEAAVAGATLIAAVSGVALALLLERRYADAAANCAQFCLAGYGAARAFVAVDAAGAHPAVTYLVTTVAFWALNWGLVVPYVALLKGRPVREVWADCWPSAPNFAVFGLLGVLLGELYRSLGPVAVPLLVVPAGVARTAFGSYLELRDAHEAALRVFVKAIEAKDRYTAGHCERVARYARYIGEELGFGPARLERLRSAALMHDIGKLAVPSRLLNKPGRLTPEEYAEVRRHNEVCVHILTRVDYLRSAVPAASDRHARYRGADERDEEALEAYVVAVADAFDAMTSTRSYRKALPQEVAFAELRDKAGTQFAPACVEALIRAIERRGERYGLGHEDATVEWEVEPPTAGLGSAGLGDLACGPGGVPA
jgi:HD superfamily phosphodiesterase